MKIPARRFMDFARLQRKKQTPPAKTACGMTIGAFFREVF
jgi:hypothetical protein